MEQTLREGLAALGLPCSAVPQLLDFSRRLLEKNQVMNLTAITAPKDVAALHLLDCAALLTLADFRGKSVVDVGTGAGFPGMVLRMLQPDFDLTLLDSLGKRIDWLRETCDEMGLARVDCVHARAEEFAAAHRQSYDMATSRAAAERAGAAAGEAGRLLPGHEVRGQRRRDRQRPGRHRPAGRKGRGHPGLHHSRHGGDPPGGGHPQGEGHPAPVPQKLGEDEESTVEVENKAPLCKGSCQPQG